MVKLGRREVVDSGPLKRSESDSPKDVECSYCTTQRRRDLGQKGKDVAHYTPAEAPRMCAGLTLRCWSTDVIVTVRVSLLYLSVTCVGLTTSCLDTLIQGDSRRSSDSWAIDYDHSNPISPADGVWKQCFSSMSSLYTCNSAPWRNLP